MAEIRVELPKPPFPCRHTSAWEMDENYIYIFDRRECIMVISRSEINDTDRQNGWNRYRKPKEK